MSQDRHSNASSSPTTCLSRLGLPLSTRSGRLQEVDATYDGLGVLVPVKRDKSKDRLANGQSLLVRISETGVLDSRGMESQKVIVVCDEYSGFLLSVFELFPI